MKQIMEYIEEQEKNQSGKMIEPTRLSELARKSGFTSLSKGLLAVENKYIAIKPDRIMDFLEVTIKAYVAENKLKTTGMYHFYRSISQHRPEDMQVSVWARGQKWCSPEIHYAIEWRETDIGEYLRVPPQEVFDRLIKAKDSKIFDYYRVCTVSEVFQVKDPILVGRINGDSNRYFIAQWDNDLLLDNLI